VGRLDNEGSLYYHSILFLVFLILFVSLKNFDFTDFRNSPILTDTQVLVLQILYIFLLVQIAIISFRGYFIKTPEYATRGLFSLVIVSLGVFIILFNFLWDPVNEIDTAIGGLGTLSIAISSLIIAAGMVVYIFIKFIDDRQQQWFVEAVKDSIENMGGSVTSSSARRRRAGRFRADRRKARGQMEVTPIEKEEYTEPISEPEETPMLPPKTTPVQSAPSAPSSAASGAGGAGAGGWTQAPGQSIIKCPQCTMPLKIPDVPTRPLSIRCPHCGSISTIHA
jgi:hypothetical protein